MSTGCYEKFLGRKADDAGLNAWANVLLTGQNNAKEAASGFVFSNELKGQNLSNEDYVKRLYQGLFDREADSEGLSQWVSQLDKGVSREDIFYVLLTPKSSEIWPRVSDLITPGPALL